MLEIKLFLKVKEILGSFDLSNQPLSLPIIYSNSSTETEQSLVLSVAFEIEVKDCTYRC